MAATRQPERLYVTFKFTEKHKKWALKQISVFQQICIKFKIQISPPLITMEIGVAIARASFAESITLNRSLARAVHGVGSAEEDGTLTNVLYSLKESLDDVYENLEDFKELVDGVDKIGLVEYENSKFLKFICRINFSKGLLECLSERDSNNINKFKDNEYRALCNQLGLREEMCNYLPDGEILTHKSALDWLLFIIQRNYENLENENDTFFVLQEIGFTKSVASSLAMWIDKNEVLSHKSILHWAICFLLTSFYDAIDKQAGKKDEFPFEKLKLGQCYNGVPVETESQKVTIFGVNNEFSQNKSHDITETLKTLIKREFKPNQSEKFWYHGTNLDAEESIRSKGIDLACGNPGDFSKNGEGFYLAADLNHALDYANAFNKSRKFFSVLVFKVDNFRQSFPKGIDLTDNKPLWIKATDYYHNHKRNNQKEPPELRKLWYIEGPTSRYDGSGRKDSSFHQLCIRKKKMAAYFHSKLVCVLYFKSM